ncbi:hypothetical protein KMW28_05605 [Flammeovirga yaeyamensis]|uniref:Uncharacterized protein n=1 Tax=Flammeovirga yaeyamensis TaxID=367791 RepID=A0AAX1N6G5_9BACT|nr:MULTISPECIES: hypothetical protein [Flammeovirga]ANQ49468.1 hypothetical protein MY04_2094 [Flammeovirga sp. MY04]MBB3697641.1 hypothetical protein [Flammeovirga yaeyamensis]NMF35999.1 hypothetical protein [Flammeovirga yaeyamensis]QWG03055.1 hypothetical protein KMW28_05605 [Flammeovirga yaeyamensis]
MRKTNKRYYGKAIKEKASLMIGREIDVVTKEGRCIHGILKSVDDTAYHIVDLLAGKHKVAFEEIDEVIDKIEAEY